MPAPEPSPLEAARRERATLFERIAWWEHHRYEALIPVAIVCFGVGWGIGHVLHVLFGLPYQSGYLAAVATLFLAGRTLTGYFAPSRLDALDARIARLEREERRAQKS
jgi:hypothetical protein